jgi:hypothetical protein
MNSGDVDIGSTSPLVHNPELFRFKGKQIDSDGFAAERSHLGPPGVAVTMDNPSDDKTWNISAD